ncbi:MAG: FtsX-like permease family protein, partial [Bacteroidales bacterium]
TFLISGVIVDFFQRSPKEVIEPQAFWIPQRYQGYFTVNYGNQQPQHVISQIEPLYESFFPANPFDYFFLDEYYNAQFSHDRRFGTVFALFSMMVVLVTVMGLVGLSVYTAEQRKKEIGIRKILGASDQRIFLMLFRDYLWLWMAAAVLAIPVVWHFLNRWLGSFAVRIEVSPWLFVMPLLLVLFISLITVWSMSRKIVSLNPVENIKYE